MTWYKPGHNVLAYKIIQYFVMMHMDLMKR